jgi:hypothetical protein
LAKTCSSSVVKTSITEQIISFVGIRAYERLWSKTLGFDQKRSKALNGPKRRSEMLARPKIARRVEWCARSACLTAGTPRTGRNEFFWGHFVAKVKKIKGQVGAPMLANDSLAKTASRTLIGALVRARKHWRALSSAFGQKH